MKLQVDIDRLVLDGVELPPGPERLVREELARQLAVGGQENIAADTGSSWRVGREIAREVCAAIRASHGDSQ